MCPGPAGLLAGPSPIRPIGPWPGQPLGPCCLFQGRMLSHPCLGSQMVSAPASPPGQSPPCHPPWAVFSVTPMPFPWAGCGHSFALPHPGQGGFTPLLPLGQDVCRSDLLLYRDTTLVRSPAAHPCHSAGGGLAHSGLYPQYTAELGQEGWRGPPRSHAV